MPDYWGGCMPLSLLSMNRSLWLNQAQKYKAMIPQESKRTIRNKYVWSCIILSVKNILDMPKFYAYVSLFCISLQWVKRSERQDNTSMIAMITHSYSNKFDHSAPLTIPICPDFHAVFTTIGLIWIAISRWYTLDLRYSRLA